MQQILSELMTLLIMLSALLSPKLGAVEPLPKVITIQKKDYTEAEYTILKTSLAEKVDNKIGLSMDEDNNEQAQFFEAVEIERQKCGGKIGAVNGNVVEAMSKLLSNGCPK